MLDKMLHGQKHAFDKSSLGFDKYDAASLNIASTSKTMFVKLVKEEEAKAIVALLGQGQECVFE